jgi:hypothetical protein
MSRWVVDTNVPVVANGGSDKAGNFTAPSVSCRVAAVTFLQSLLKSGVILLDIDGEIQE